MKNDLLGSFFYDRGGKHPFRAAFRKGRMWREAGTDCENKRLSGRPHAPHVWMKERKFRPKKFFQLNFAFLE